VAGGLSNPQVPLNSIRIPLHEYDNEERHHAGILQSCNGNVSANGDTVDLSFVVQRTFVADRRTQQQQFPCIAVNLQGGLKSKPLKNHQ